LDQKLLAQLLVQGVITSVKVQNRVPTKGKAINVLNKLVWSVSVVTISGGEMFLNSSRGSPREWASLDRLAIWLRSNGFHNFHVMIEQL
jgi:hypothetical protein